MQLGGGTLGQAANNVIFKNSTITNVSANTFPEGLDIQQGQDLLVDSVVVFINNAGQPLDSDLSAIHIGGADQPVVGCVIRNCIIQGQQ